MPIEDSTAAMGTVQNFVRAEMGRLNEALAAELREAFLDQGSRAEGIVPPQGEVAAMQNLAVIAVRALHARMVPILAGDRIEPKDTLPGETTEQTIKRRILPDMMQKIGETIVKNDLGVSAAYIDPADTSAVFASLTVALRMPKAEQVAAPPAEQAEKRIITPQRPRLVVP